MVKAYDLHHIDTAFFFRRCRNSCRLVLMTHSPSLELCSSDLPIEPSLYFRGRKTFCRNRPYGNSIQMVGLVCDAIPKIVHFQYTYIE